MKPLIIGIAGPARAGKDTLCDYLRLAFMDRGINAKRYAFADPMKRGLAEAFNLNEDHLYGSLKEKPILEYGNKSPRQILQWFGTDFARNWIDQDIWLKVANSYINDYVKAGYDVVIIPDVRFDNEAMFIRNKGGFIIHIERKDRQSINRHKSENGIMVLEADSVMNNNGSYEDLAVQAVKWIDDSFGSEQWAI